MSYFHREREQDNAWTVRVRDPRDEYAKVTVYLDSATTARMAAIATALDWDEDRDVLDGDPVSRCCSPSNGFSTAPRKRSRP